jgi:hypothetical protein
MYAAILIFIGLPAGHAQAENRVALVIGNGAYASAPLTNPVHDAQDMATALGRAGFDVIHRENVDRSAMRAAIREFGRKIRQGGVGLFYFAGHGVQVDGANYLVPLGSNIEEEFEVADEAVDADSILRAMGNADNQLNIIILDACRNNPFARSFRSANRGLARMSAPTGSLVSYATAPGSVAADGDGRNGVYTKHLLDAMQQPGRTLEQVFKQVRINVDRDTAGKQVPWEESSLTGDFYFTPGSGVVASAAPIATPVVSSQFSSESRYWATVADSQDPAEYDAYLQRYPNGEYADIAMARRDRYLDVTIHSNAAAGQGQKVAMINPVFYRNTENRYATVAVRDYVAAQTPYDVVEINPATAQTNRRNQSRGIAPEYPDNIDYVFTSTIIKSQSRREANPSYKASSANESNFGKQLLNSVTSKTFQYYLVSNVDVEVGVVLPKQGQQMTNIERLEYRVPLTDDVNQNDLTAEASITASVDALQATMLKYDLATLPETAQQEAPAEEPQSLKIFNSFLKSATKQ